MKTFPANKELQRKLRSMIDCDGLTEISRQLIVGREPLARYLADLPLHTATFRGIEASVAAAAFDPLPKRKPRNPAPKGATRPQASRAQPNPSGR